MPIMIPFKQIPKIILLLILSGFLLLDTSLAQTAEQYNERGQANGSRGDWKGVIADYT